MTGANKGIGYAMVKRLSELGVTVILTARDNARGLKAVETLKGLGFDVFFHCLDISDHASILDFASWFKHQFGQLDILVSFHIYSNISDYFFNKYVADLYLVVQVSFAWNIT